MDLNVEAIKNRKLPELQELTPTDKRQALKKNELVRQPIARMDGSVLPGQKKKATCGRKKKYTPTKMKNAINGYFDWCEENDRIPSIKGLMIHLKMYRDQFYQYLEYPEFTDIMEHARLIIAEWCENDVYRTRGQAAGKIAYMKNVHDWSEKTENNTTVTKIVTADEARAKIEMLAPKLLEALRNTDVLKQLVPQQQEEKVVEAEIVQIPSLGFVDQDNNPRRLQKTQTEIARSA